MNEQPSAIVGNLGALIFTLGMIYYIMKGYREKCIVLDDSFVIGHVFDYDNRRTVSHNFKQHSPIVAAVKPKIKQQPQQPSQLYLDCVEALVALGMKKTQAKHTTNQVFSTTKINTIQEFLNIALKTP